MSIQSLKSSLILWWISLIEISAEIILGFMIAVMLGGMSWSLFSGDSFVELSSTFIVLRFLRYQKYHEANHHIITDADFILSKKRRTATRSIAGMFFILAILGPLFSWMFGEPANDNWWTTAIAWGFLAASLILGVLKWRASGGHGGLLGADAMQTLTCSLSGIPVLVTAYFQVYSEWVDFVCALSISGLMMFLGYITWKHQDLHVH